MYQGEYVIRIDASGSKQFIPNGQGRYSNCHSDLFEGTFRDGRRVDGKLLFHSGCTYEGRYNENELPHGSGRFTWSDGRTYKGTFTNSRIDGQGEFSNFVPGCNLVTFSGISLNGEFSSDLSHQNIAKSDFLKSYTDSFASSVKPFLKSLTADLAALLSKGPEDTNDAIQPFTAQYMLQPPPSEDSWAVGGLVTDLGPVEPRPTLRSFRLRLPQLLVLAESPDLRVECFADAPGYPPQLVHLGQVVTLTCEPAFTLWLVLTADGLRVAEVRGEALDEKKALAAIFPKKK